MLVFTHLKFIMYTFKFNTPDKFSANSMNNDTILKSQCIVVYPGVTSSIEKALVP